MRALKIIEEDIDISIDSDEHYGDNQDSAIDQTGSGSNSYHLEIKDEIDEEASGVIENPNDDVVAYETDEEEPRPVTGFQEVFNQTWSTMEPPLPTKCRPTLTRGC